MEPDMTIEFTAVELNSAGEALQHANADPRFDTALLLDGKPYAMAKREAERLESAGVEFAYLFDHELPDGRSVIMTVPVN